MVKERLTLKVGKLFKRGLVLGRGDSVGNLRGKIVIMAVVLLIVMILYQTYFESAPKEESDKINELPQLLKTATPIAILQNESYSPINWQLEYGNLSNASARVYNPSITKTGANHYLLAYELEIGGYSNIWLSDSMDGIAWNTPWPFNDNITDVEKPHLKSVQEQEFILSFELNGKRYIQNSRNGSKWSIQEPWELQMDNKSLYYANNYILVANQTGLWLSDYSIDVDWQNPISVNFTNASILKINDYKFLIVHENSVDDFNSFTITTIYFKEPESEKTTIKWDLLIIFIVLGLIFLTMIVQEVAHD